MEEPQGQRIVGGRVICAHRANFGHGHPPNSLAAVESCVESGVDRLEVDVRFLSDDSMLVHHDGYVLGAAGTRAQVAEVDRRGILALPASVELCFLDDVVRAMASGATVLQVDLKQMRPLSPVRVQVLATALEPLRGRVIVGSMAHWNLRPLAALGLPVALDPTLHIHYAPGRTGDDLSPARTGHHGFWDDAPLAHIPGVNAEDYLRTRVDDLVRILPEANEWMVDVRTLLHMADLGFDLGHELAERGVALAAWTVRDEGREATTALLRRLFDLGATTVIADDSHLVSSYVA